MSPPLAPPSPDASLCQLYCQLSGACLLEGLVHPLHPPADCQDSTEGAWWVSLSKCFQPYPPLSPSEESTLQFTTIDVFLAAASALLGTCHLLSNVILLTSPHVM